MVNVPSLAARLSPTTVGRLERAARQRYEEGECLRQNNRLLAAIYFYGYSVEMYLTAASFRRAGFQSDQPIDDDTRRRRMAQARGLRFDDGTPLMSGEPHPLVGWARFLRWQRKSERNLKSSDQARLQEAVRRAEQVYKHWRPELRYKLANVSIDQLSEVRLCVHWFAKQFEHL